MVEVLFEQSWNICDYQGGFVGRIASQAGGSGSSPGCDNLSRQNTLIFQTLGKMRACQGFSQMTPKK